MDSAHSPRGRVDAFVDAHLEVDHDADPHSVACWLSLAVEATRESEVQSIFREAVQTAASVLESLVLEVLRAEGRDVAEAAAIAGTIMGGINGSYLLGAAVPGLLPGGSAAPMIRRSAAALLDSQPQEKGACVSRPR